MRSSCGSRMSGLALDPEWRLRPGEVHLQQIGTVDAAEINQVVRWLAGLVRTEALPQKLLILHQFRFSMITNRELVETPAELAVMIHMDGQGPIATKYSTWNALTGEPDAHRFYWGWKNFYDEDFPTPTAEQVLAQTPSPLFVSYHPPGSSPIVFRSCSLRSRAARATAS